MGTEININAGQMLCNFLSKARKDVRLGSSHICIFSSLVALTIRQQEHPISFYSKEVRDLAKLSNRTYHQCMQELHRYGYIKYIPSYNPALGSMVWFE